MIGMNPYWWAPINKTMSAPLQNVLGIFKLSTNAVTVSDDTVDYGVNPTLFRQLPNESIVILTIHSDAPDDSTLPITIVVPTTSSTIRESTNTNKMKVVDSQGAEVTGANVKGGTQRLVYINKSAGIIRFMEFINQ